jgi:hypothetical protein
VALLRRVPVCHDLGYGRTTEVTRHVAESEDSADGRHVEMAVAEGHTAGPLKVARQHVDLVGPMIAVAIDHRMHLPLIAGTNEYDAGRTERHLPRVGHIGGVDGDAEPWWKLDVVDLGGGPRNDAGQVPAEPAADAAQHAERPEDGGDLQPAGHGVPVNHQTGATTRTAPGRGTRGGSAAPRPGGRCEPA